jgi:hypothetical protein
MCAAPLNLTARLLASSFGGGERVEGTGAAAAAVGVSVLDAAGHQPGELEHSSFTVLDEGHAGLHSIPLALHIGFDGRDAA